MRGQRTHCPAAGKVRYRDKVRAEQILTDLKGRRDLSGESNHNESRAYHCRDCDGWHLTSRRS